MSLVYTITWYSSRAIFQGLFQGRFFHPERLPAEGPVILASNHASYMDPPLIGCGLSREVNYLARDTLFKYKIGEWLLKQLHCVPVDREGAGAAGLKGILDRLSKGGVILLFPEGTRTQDGSISPARAGVGLTVIKSRAPVLPVRVFGTFEAYSRHASVPSFHPVAVKYGKPMRFESLREEAKKCSKDRLKAIYQQVSDSIMQEIRSLQPCRDVETFP